jgi:hypothetical protein
MMAPLRRRRLPPELEPAFAAFGAVVERVEAAKGALTEAVPSTRHPGRPLPDALLAFEAALREGAARMDAWRVPALEAPWRRCAEGIEIALERAERLRLEAPDLGGFEGLIGLVGDLLSTLDAFEAALEAFRALRA